MVEDEAIVLDDDDVGKDVLDDTDEKVGVVTEVDEDANLLYVDPNPGLAQRVKTRLGWEGHDEDAYSVEPDRIAEIDDDHVRLRSCSRSRPEEQHLPLFSVQWATWQSTATGRLASARGRRRRPRGHRGVVPRL
ncbi:hypothetical protein [Halorussus caseinilyticus]|uniref:PRC-barrel domain containing protein n=1 Tax=Halorussus caseinilyticus TaxID=3034025 RepID=A0ABD5WJZ1_9EURY